MSEKKITVRQEGKEDKVLDAPEGAVFLQLLKRNGYPLVCCSGKGTCGRCRIRFGQKGAPLPAPADRIAFTPEELRGGLRLACMHRVRQDCCLQVECVESRPVEAVTAHKGATGNINGRGLQEECPVTDRPAPYLIAVDLGTTTIAMQAVELPSVKEWQQGGELLIRGEYSCMNPQRQWGSDVLSRIQAAAQGQAGALTESVREGIAEGIGRLVRERGRAPACIWLAGNTAMEHLLMGLDTAALGRYPFTPVSLEEMELKLLTGGTQLRIGLLPGISAFVGADIAAGLLACGLGKGTEEGCRLFIDLGTNGEMAIAGKGRLLCTAAAAGPAFEGGAAANVPGTDMLALLAEMLDQGIIDETGLLEDAYFEHGWQKGRIRITQQDIRALQMAKAAVCAGVELLMEALGAQEDDVVQVCLAGGFGYYLDVEKAARIGLFPAGLAGKVTAVGNTSLLGACLYGGDPSLREITQALCRRAEVLNLAEQPGFEARYLSRIHFKKETKNDEISDY